MNIFELVNKLLKSSEYKSKEEFQKMVDSKLDTFNAIVPMDMENILVFQGIESFSIFEYVKNEFYNMNGEIANTVTMKDFIKYLNKLILSSKKENTEITKDSIQILFKEILEVPTKKYNIIKGIYGIKLIDNEKELKLGPFDVFFQTKYKEILSKTYPPPLGFLWERWEYDYLVTVSVNARTENKANELADDMLYMLELFIYFAIGQYKKEFCVNIVSKITKKYDSYLIFDEETIGANFSNDFVDFVPLDDEYFTDSSIGNNKIWDLLFVKQKTSLENRIISAIEWIGKANCEINYKNRFLFYVFALESILNYQEKDMISPSIAHRITESTAMLLGKSYEERILIEKKVKEIYKIRSALAHGTNKDVSNEEMYLAMTISRNVVIEFLTNSDLVGMNNIENFYDYLKKKKYM
jgi:hypothetical protein